MKGEEIMKFKRLIAPVAAGIIGVGVLAGCGGSGGSESTTAATTTAASTTTAAATAATTSSTTGGLHREGRKAIYRILGAHDCQEELGRLGPHFSGAV